MVRPDELVAHARFVRSVARDLVREPDVADDVAQSTLLIGLERPPRSSEGLMAWIVSVARSVAATVGRRERSREIHEPSAAVRESQPSAVDVVAHEEIVRRVVDAVFALEEPYRTAILLRYYEDLKPGAIARRLAVPVETVRTRLKRGLARMRERLDERSGGGRGAWAAALSGTIRLPANGGMSIVVKAAAVLVVFGGVSLLAWRTSGANERMTKAAAELAAHREPIAVGETSLAASRAAMPDATTATTAPPFDPALIVRGTVVDEEGRPIAGARVYVLERDGVPNADAPARLVRDLVVSGDRGDASPAAVTSSDGSFLLQGLPLRMNLLLFEADGFRVQTTYSRPCNVLRRQLSRCAPLRGVVIDEVSGVPLADVGVLFSLDGMDGGNVRRWVRTTTTRDGAFEFAKAARSKRATLTLDRLGCMPVAVECDVSFEGDASHTTARWPATKSFAGRVVDDATGSPIAGATLSRFDDAWYSFSGWERDEAGFRRIATSDANGGFEVGVAAPEKWTVVTAPRHLPRRVTFPSPDREGDATVIRLFSAPTVEGVVRDADGRSVSGALLHAATRGERLNLEARRRLGDSVRPPRSIDLFENACTTSDADGRFEFEFVFDDDAWSAGFDEFQVRVGAILPRLGNGASEVVAVRFSDTVVPATVRFGREGARKILTGRLLAAGAGIAGNVHCEACGESWDVDTADDGSFAFETSESCDAVELTGVPRDFRFGGDESCRVHATVRLESESTTRHDLEVRGRRGRITGTVRGTDGRPIPADRIRAFLRLPDGRMVFTERGTDANGEFSFDLLDLFGDRFEVTAVHGTWTESRLDIPLGAKDVDFVVPELGKIRLAIRERSTGKNLNWASIATRAIGETVFTLHASDGKRQITDPDDLTELELPLGTYDMQVGDAAGRLTLVTLEHIVVAKTPGEPLLVELSEKPLVQFRIVNDDEAFSRHCIFLLRAPEVGHVRGGLNEAHGWEEAIDLPDVLDRSEVLSRSKTFRGERPTVQLPVVPDHYVLFALPDDLEFDPAEIDVPDRPSDPIEIHAHRRDRNGGKSR